MKRKKIRIGEEDMSREEEEIEWSVEGQMLHRIAKRKEREQVEKLRSEEVTMTRYELERDWMPILRADNTCSHANVYTREVMYMVERTEGSTAYCKPCLDEMIAIGDEPNLEWIEGIA